MLDQRRVVEAHGGRLEARNNADGGATVSFTLPVDDAGSLRAAELVRLADRAGIIVKS